jgi:plasmid replication initiation protein
MVKKTIIVKEPEELILMKGDFSEGALKLAAYLIAILEKDKVIYQINIKEYLKKFDKKIGNYNYLHAVAKELSQKQFEINDRFNKRFEIYNFISGVTYKDGILKVEFSQMFMNYLLAIKDKFLKYNIKNIMSLNSKYSIRLYKILKDQLEKNARYGKKAEFEISLEKLMEFLEIPTTYQYSSGIKKRILEKSRKDFEKNTDIIFDYEEIKSGRKVTHLKFFIRSNPKKPQENNSIDDNYFSSRRNFVSLLRKNYSGNGKFFGFKTFEDGIYWLGLDNNGLVYGTIGGNIKDFNAVESAKIYDLWLTIAQNSELYKELVLNGVCLKDLSQNNKEVWLELREEIIRLKEEGII